LLGVKRGLGDGNPPRGPGTEPVGSGAKPPEAGDTLISSCDGGHAPMSPLATPLVIGIGIVLMVHQPLRPLRQILEA